MNPTLTLLALTLCLMTGCAKMGTRQIDENSTIRYEITPAGETNAIVAETRKTATSASGVAIGAGQTALEGFAAKQDGSNQGLEIKKSAQKTDGLSQAKEIFGMARDIGAMMYGMPPAQSVQPAPQPVLIAPQSIQPASLPPPPAGQKWILVPKDDPSTPQPEQ